MLEKFEKKKKGDKCVPLNVSMNEPNMDGMLQPIATANHEI